MLTGVAAFLFLLIALLAIPITLRFHVSWREALQDDVRLLWAFGLVRVRIPLQTKARTHEAVTPKKKPRASKRASRKRLNVVAALRQPRFRRRIANFLKDLWHAVHKKNLSLRVRVGLGDPADTGQLWAIVGPAAGMLSTVRHASIHIEPEFVDPTFEVDGSGVIRLIPLQMIYLVIALLLSPPVWRGVREMRATG